MPTDLRTLARAAIQGIPTDPKKKPGAAATVEVFGAVQADIAVIDAKVDDAFALIDDLQVSGDTVTKGTWSALSAVTGTRAGQRGEVTGPDGGTHTDPVVGGTKDNVGIYTWSTSPAGWQWLNVNDYATLNAAISTAAGNEGSLAARIDRLAIRKGANLLSFGDFEGDPFNPTRVNSSPVVDLPTTETALRNLGYTKAINWRPSLSESVNYVPDAEEKKHLFGRYYAAGFFIHSPTYTPPNAYCLLIGDGGAAIDMGGTRGRLQIDDDTYLCYHVGGQVPAQGSTNLSTEDSIQNFRIGNPNVNAAADRYATGFFIAFSNAPFQISDLPVRQRGVREHQLLDTQPTGPKLFFAANGTGYVETRRGSDTVRRSFMLRGTPKATPLLVGERPTFSQVADSFNGVTFRDMTDDEAPSFVSGAHRGGQHQFVGALGTASAHGKTTADIGSIWSKDGKQYVLIAVYSASQLVLANRTDDNDIPATGTYAHVSGATHTTSIVLTVASLQSWGPMVADYSMRVMVDDEEVSAPIGTIAYKRFATFMERYSVLPREDVIAWYIANGSSGGADVTGTPLFAKSIAYQYDHEGYLTIFEDFIELQSGLTYGWLYGIQVQNAGATQYYVANTTPFVHDGGTRNFSLIEDVASLLTDANFTSANTEDADPWLTEFVSMTDDFALAAGFLPVQAADPDVRRDDYVTGSNIGMSMATSVKTYMRIYNAGSHTGDGSLRLSWVSYRNPLRRPDIADRTIAYPVRTRGTHDYFRISWHDRDGLDHVPMPADFLGRDFEVAASRNATVLSMGLTGELTVEVDAEGDYGFLMLKVAR